MQRTNGVDSARRVLEILLQFSRDKPELSVDDIVAAADVSLPSAYRYISLLREKYLIEERRKGYFVLSPEILQLADAAERSMEYSREIEPVLNQLRDQTGETALYLRQLNDAAVCVAIAEPDLALRISFQPGHVMPLHAGAGAKVILSGLTKAKRDAYINKLDPPMPEAARDKLVESLTQIKTRGIAVSEGEVDEGAWACAASVTSHGRSIGAISLVAPSYRLDEQRRQAMIAAITDGADQISRLLARG